MQESSWSQKSIKMASHSNNIATGKVVLNRLKNRWEIKVSAFWTSPVKGELFMVGDTARKILDIDASEGAYSANKKLPALTWDEFIYSAKLIVIISNEIPILKANIPPIKSMDIFEAMEIIEESNGAHHARTKRDIIKSNVIAQAKQSEQEDIEHKKNIKKLLSIKPTDRIISSPARHLAKAETAEEFALVPMEWGIKEINDYLETETIAPPFIGRFEGAVFSRVEISTAYGFDHMIFGKVPVNHMQIYLLCVPGSPYLPPQGLPDYNRWIPSINGNGYWVKYITFNDFS